MEKCLFYFASDNTVTLQDIKSLKIRKMLGKPKVFWKCQCMLHAEKS